MRNTLQYLYTILVFTGALTTSYLMISQSEFRNQNRTAQTLDSKESYRREAAFDSGVSRLFEVENALTHMPASERLPAVDRSSSRASDTPNQSRAKRSKAATGERAWDESFPDEFR